tara:strand:+ start:81 stop:935 length:855 start_codon:yes stop_codon:yes gene_type:complete
MEIIKVYNEHNNIKTSNANLARIESIDTKTDTVWYCQKDDCNECNEIKKNSICTWCEFAHKHWNEQITEESMRPKFDITAIKWDITDIDKLTCNDLYKLNTLWYTLNVEFRDDYYNSRNNKNKIVFRPMYKYISNVTSYSIWSWHEYIFMDFIQKIKNGQKQFKLHKKNCNYDYEFICMIYEFILQNVFKYTYTKYNQIDKELVREDGFRYSYLGNNRFILMHEYDENKLLPNSNKDISYTINNINTYNTPNDFKDNIVDYLYFDNVTISIANYPIVFTYYTLQ